MIHLRFWHLAGLAATKIHLLLIYGKTEDKELDRQIQGELKSASHVQYHNAFIPDEQIDSIFGRADIAVLPYDKTTMMNSGAAVLAFSEGKPVIVSLFGAIKDIKEKDFVYAYDYNTDTEHLDSLKSEILRAYEIWKQDKSIIAEQGKKAYEYASKELAWDQICADIVKKYRKICGESCV